jgi:hypothetical protein
MPITPGRSVNARREDPSAATPAAETFSVEEVPGGNCGGPGKPGSVAEEAALGGMDGRPKDEV